MNLYNYIAPKNGEIFDTLLDNKSIKIVRIVSSDSVDNKIYIQDEEEWVVVLEGYAVLEIDGVVVELKNGDSLFIPKKIPHRVTKTKANTLWLAIHI